MQDIDFDEIDRAVSSVTNPTTEITTPTPPVSESVAPVTAPALDPIAPRTETPVTASPAARRSSGRFMDVVHPSSDMRPKAPSAPSLHREEIPREPIVAERPAPVTTASSAFHWPDTTPSVSSFKAPEPIVEPVIAPAPVPEPVVAAPVIEEAPLAPLESPFLTDAKVEKRPLGAFSPTESDLPLLEDFNDTPTATPEPVVVEEAPVAEVSDVPDVEEEELLLEAHTQTSEVAQPIDAPAPIADVPAGPTSIVQQYKEQPATEAQASGSIYDTEAYHQALVHQPKKNSGALVIVWIAALILVGGGIGAAVYFFVLPLL